MKQLVTRLTNWLPLKKLNRFRFMPLIWWSLLLLLWAYAAGWLSASWRLGLVFLLINGVISWHLGRLSKQLNLSWYWLLWWPLLFCLIVFSRYGNYNYPLALIYLILEILAVNASQFYQERR
jgi:hypothetical protein